MPETFLVFLLLLNELEKSIYSNYSICRWCLEKIWNSTSLQCRGWYYARPYVIGRFVGWILAFHCAVARLNLHEHLPELGTWIKWMNVETNTVPRCSMTCRSEKPKLSPRPAAMEQGRREGGVLFSTQPPNTSLLLHGGGARTVVLCDALKG